MRIAAGLVLFIALYPACSSAQGAERVPDCRIDRSQNGIVEETLRRAIGAFDAMGKPVGIEGVAVNPDAAPSSAKVLHVYVIADAAADKVNADGCPTGPFGARDVLDALSVRGGCVVVAIERREMRCSAGAVRIFSNTGRRSGVANPTLLYVISHELAHFHQRRLGEYSGRAERIELQLNQAMKLNMLRDACDPVSTKLEDEADAISLQVLTRLLASPPYREPVFSERGSLFWNIDLIVLATDAWRKAALEREFASQPKLHASFNPTEFPTPPARIQKNARQFVCDVLTKRRGSVLYPGKSATHPPLEVRLQRITEALTPIAKSLPEQGGASDFAPIARLQGDLSPIFSHIYRETGAYLEALQAQICTTVNALNPKASCR